MPVAIRTGLEVRGLPEVRAALAGVKDGVQNRVVKKGLDAVAKPTLKKAKAYERRKRTRQLQKSLGIRPRAYGRGATRNYVVVVGPRRGFTIVGPDGRRIDPAKYGHLVEKGRKAVRAGRGSVLTWVVARGRGKGGRVFTRSVRAFPGDPFMGPANEYLKLIAPGILSTVIPPAVAAEAARYAAKGKSVLKG
jgi:hypothetical protein